MKTLSAIAVILFCSGYWICDLLLVNGSGMWWDLRLSIYTVIFALCFTVAWKLTAGMTKAIFFTGMVFCAGDILDRYFFNIQKFHINDLALYLFAAFYLIRAYAREIKAHS